MIVINTRPEADPLSAKLQALRVENQHYPMQLIQPLEEEMIAKQMQAQSDVSKIIFLSPNAVRFSKNVLIEFLHQQDTNITLFAVGQKTAALASSEFDCEVRAPEEQFSSEALLELPELQSVSGETILIIGAVGGRQLIQETLLSRSSHVSLIEVYKRQMPQQITLLPEDDLILICTSSDAMSNFFKIYSEALQTKKNQLQWLLSSQRLKQLAIESFGVSPESINLVKNASDEAIVAHIKRKFYDQASDTSCGGTG